MFISKRELTTKILEVMTLNEDSKFHEECLQETIHCLKACEKYLYTIDTRGFEANIQVAFSSSNYSRLSMSKVNLTANVLLVIIMPGGDFYQYESVETSVWISMQDQALGGVHTAAKSFAIDIRKTVASMALKAWGSSNLLHIREERELRITLATTEQQAKKEGSGKRRL